MEKFTKPEGTITVRSFDTPGGPGFGFQHYKNYDFLQPKEVVLTFDDGPLPPYTNIIPWLIGQGIDPRGGSGQG